MSSHDTSIEAPDLTADDFLTLDDPQFDPSTVAIVTGAASGIGRSTVNSP